ncbi:hypothetical protein [Sedimentitalea xiamensis]|nr:hypothetical protein [Sedimentitalea xiamensis]
MKKLYIHVGAHRTATTNIQATMFHNWKNLLDLGYLYPLGVQRHIGVFNNIFKGKASVRAVSIDLLKRSENQNKTIHSIVLSDEDICMRRDLSPLRAFKEFFDVKIVFGMRRQDLWLESWWAQNVKGQWDPVLSHRSWDDFIADRRRFHWIDYNKYLEHIADVFGKESILPYVFESRKMPEGPVAEFCRKLGIKSISKWNAAGGRNISLTPEMSEFVRHLPFDQARMGYRLKFIEAAEKVDAVIRAEGSSNLLLQHEQRREIMDEYDPGNKAVARNYFNSSTLFDEPLPSKSSAIGKPCLPMSTDVVMSRLVAPFISELVSKFDKKP